MWFLTNQGDIINADMPTRISTIFYFGLEGLGSLEMESDESENVCYPILSRSIPPTYI